MENLASYILKKKAASLWKWPNIGKLLLNFSLAVLCGLSVGFMAGMLSNYFISEKVLSLSQYLFFYSLFLGFPTLLIDIVPSLKPPAVIFQAYYPVSLIEKVKISVITNFIRNYFLFLILSYSLMILMSDYIAYIHFAISSLFVLSVYLVNRVLSLMLNFTIPASRVLLITNLSMLGLLVLVFFILENLEVLMGLFVLVFLLAFGMLISVEHRKREKLYSTKKRVRTGILNGVLSNKNLKNLIWLSIVFKVLILVFAGSLYLKNGKSFFGFEGFDWLFASPVILFTYFGYNFFGINRNLFFTHALRVHSLNTLFVVYSKVMSLLLLVDISIFSLYVVLTNQYSFKFVVFYVASFLLLFISAFPVSLYLPVIKEKYYSLDFTSHGSKVVSFRATLIAIGIMSATMLANYSRYYGVIYAALVISAVFFTLLYPLNLQRIIRNFYIKIRSM